VNPELAEPSGGIFICRVRRLKPTREFRQWTFVDNTQHCLLAATDTEWVVPVVQVGGCCMGLRTRRHIIGLHTYVKGICKSQENNLAHVGAIWGGPLADHRRRLRGDLIKTYKILTGKKY